MADEAKRRIVDVEVKEVSLVDHAANLRRFLVIKRVEEENSMGAFQERSNAMTEAELKKAKEMEEEEKKKAEMEEEEKKKAAEKEAEEEEKKKADDKEAEEKRQAAEKEKEKLANLAKAGGMNPKAVAGMLRSMKGAPKEAVAQVVEWLDAQKATKEDEETEQAKTQKNLDGVQVAIMEDGGVFVSGQPVVKSKKFTESRTNTLKEVAMQLMKLVGDVDENAAKAMSDELKAIADGKSPTSAVRPVGKSVEAIESLQSENVELKKRLDAIENTRAPSKSAAEGGGTDSQKVEKTFWGGVL